MGKWLVCSAWPYINAVPHLGTLIGSVLSADVFARYLRMKGEEVVFVSGSDEHGTPIEVEAIRNKADPKVFTDKMHALVSKLFKEWGISFSNYTRTENEIHKKFVQEFYMKLYENGYIFTQEEVGLYCEKCNRYLPDRFVEGTCPYCGYDRARGDQCDNCGRLLDPAMLINPKCVICGSTPIEKKTKHWYFDLPKFEDALREYIKNNKQFPDNAKKFSIQMIDDGLRPRSITRDNKWGIPAPFPGADGKTIYVWMEAVLGYVSATIEWSIKNNLGDKWKDFWFDPETKSVYFIAKDNIPFHTIIFPALLMASKEGYVLPWQVASTEFLLYEGQPFSKSRRIGIWADEALKYFPPDYYRFVLISIRPEKHDTSFKWDQFISLVNDELNDILGNFIHRCLTFIYRYFDGRIPNVSTKDFDNVDKEIVTKIENAPDNVAKYLDQFKYKDALKAVVSLARDGNQYLNNKEPWKLIKEDKIKAGNVLYLCAQLVRSIAILIAPFLPFTAEQIWKDLLNLNGSVHEQNWQDAGELQLPSNHAIAKPKPLFKKVPTDFRPS